MTKYADIFAALAAPFPPEAIQETTGKGGVTIRYATARRYMNRLDDVVGPEGWTDTYQESKSGVVCTLTLTMPDGREISKTDAGGANGMADEGDNEKSAYTDAFKRACVKFGLGRYLYQDGAPEFVRALCPEIDTALPPKEAPRPQQRGQAATPRPAPAPRPERPADVPRPETPSNGRELWGFVKDQEATHDIVLVTPLEEWAAKEGFRKPRRFMDWTKDEITRGVTWIAERIDALNARRAQYDRDNPQAQDRTATPETGSAAR